MLLLLSLERRLSMARLTMRWRPKLKDARRRFRAPRRTFVEDAIRLC